MRARHPRRFGLSLAASRFLRALSSAFILYPSSFILFCCCLLPAAFADIQAPPRATAQGERRIQRRGDGPATALPLETAVEQGGRVEIILRAEGQVGRMIYFLIRTPPKHGTLIGPPTQVSRNVASIGYVHEPGDDATADEFTFCAQAVGSAVSAPETVRIRILPAPPVIEVSPPELDFGAVKAGEVARAEFTLANRGGSDARGRVDPPSPWIVDGSPDYVLPRGGSQTFRLIFRPQDEQVFNNELHFQFETHNGVHLVGTGLMDAAQRAALAANRSGARPGGVGATGGTGVAGNAGGAGTTGGGLNGGFAGNGTRLAPHGASTIPGLTDQPGASSSAPAVAASGTSSISRPAEPVIPRLDGGVATSQEGNANPALANGDVTSVPLNEASVDRVDVRNVSGDTVDLSWRPPVPKPVSYRVELRYLSTDDDDKLRIDWRPYAQTDFSVSRDLVTAHLRRVPQEGFQMLRIVAVDHAGRLASPSPMITVLMPWPATWWHVTPLKVLVVLLVICGFLVIRRRLENLAILREIDDDRAEAARADKADLASRM